MELTDALMEGLSLTGARARDRRAAIARAGGRIVRADPRYLQVDVDRDGDTAAGYRLRAVRRDGDPRGEVLEATATSA